MDAIFELSEKELDDLIVRLKAYSLSKFGHKNRDFGGMDGPDGLVNEALVSALDGTRNWNKEKYPTLCAYLISIIDSVFYNQYHSKSASDVNLSCLSDQDSSDLELEAETRHPSSLFQEKDYYEEIKYLSDGVVLILIDKFKDDPVVSGIIQCFREDILKPSEIAIILEEDVKTIYNAQKRLKTFVRKELTSNKKEYQNVRKQS